MSSLLIYPILDDLIGVAMVLGDDHTWHAGAYLEVHRYYHLSVTVDHQLNRVTAG